MEFCVAKSVFCWLMPGDNVSFRCVPGGRPALVDFPVRLLPPDERRQVLSYLEDCARYRRAREPSPHAVAEFFLASPHLRKVAGGRDDPSALFDALCELSLPRRRARAVDAIFSDPTSAPCDAEVGLRVARKWYEQQTLRRVYNLQVTKRELRASGLTPTKFYAVCLRIPFLVAAISMEKAKLVCQIIGIPVTKEIVAMGRVVRVIWEQKVEYGNLAVPEARLAKVCPCYADVAAKLIEEDSITVLEFEPQGTEVTASTALVCFSDVARMMREVAGCLVRRRCIRPEAGAETEIDPGPEIADAPRVATTPAVNGVERNRTSPDDPQSVGAERNPVDPGDHRSIGAKQNNGFRNDHQSAAAGGGTIGRKADWVAGVKWNDASLDCHQRQAINSILDQSVAVISGEAGTGKTTTIVELALQAQVRGLSYHVAAFTGKAATKLRRTFAQKGVVPDDSAITTIHRMIFQGCPERDLLIFDESSMIPTGLFHWLMRSTGWIPRAKLVFVGDPAQLPPIEAGRLFREILETKVPNHCLVTNFRFAGDGAGIAAFARWVLDAKETSPDCVPACEGVRVLAGDLGFARELITSIVADGGIRPSNFKVICPFRKDVAQLNGHLRALYGHGDAGVVCGDKVFEIGERVMMTHNDYKAGIFNGDEGIVTSVKDAAHSDRDSELTVNFDIDEAAFVQRPADIPDPNRPNCAAPVAAAEKAEAEEATEARVVEFFNVPPRLFDENEDDVAEARLLAKPAWRNTREAFEDANRAILRKSRGDGPGNDSRNIDKPSVHELDYAYALTVHKAQGNEWENVVVFIPAFDNPMLTNALFYTAITRARQRLWVVCSPSRLLKIVTTPLSPVIDPTHLMF